MSDVNKYIYVFLKIMSIIINIYFKFLRSSVSPIYDYTYNLEYSIIY